jgi:hypothetical protein
MLAVACTGPALHVANPERHRVFVDGVATAARELPFRYYGTAVWDALPADDARGRAVWQTQPTRQHVELPAPVTPWLFPLDFPIELIARAVHGRPDVHTTVAVDAADHAKTLATWMLNLELAAVVQRAKAARATR